MGGVGMDYSAGISVSKGLKSGKRHRIKLEILSQGADNDTESMAAWNACSFPYSTSTGVIGNIDKIIA
jgi:hypothetical protein